MPFPESAAAKGGSRPATATQKEAARQWAIANAPWQHSTGPRSKRGKAVSSKNRTRKTGWTFHRIIKSWEVDDFWGECARAEAVVAALQCIKEEYEFSIQGVSLQISLEVSREQKGDDQGNRWAVYLARLTKIQLPVIAAPAAPPGRSGGSINNYFTINEAKDARATAEEVVNLIQWQFEAETIAQFG